MLLAKLIDSPSFAKWPLTHGQTFWPLPFRFAIRFCLADRLRSIPRNTLPARVSDRLSGEEWPTNNRMNRSRGQRRLVLSWFISATRLSVALARPLATVNRVGRINTVGSAGPVRIADTRGRKPLGITVSSTKKLITMLNCFTPLQLPVTIAAIKNWHNDEIFWCANNNGLVRSTHRRFFLWLVCLFVLGQSERSSYLLNFN